VAAANARSEERVTGHRRVRLRGSGPEIDAQVLDASSRGMLLSAAEPVRHGEIVEVLQGSQVLVGQVRWTRGNQFGVKLGDRIDVQAFLAGRGGEMAAARPVPAAAAARAETVEESGFAYNFVYFSAAAIASIGFLAVAVQRLAG
jgi:hypothetical protein